MSPTIANTEVVLDHDTHTIILTRLLAAPSAQVFEAWTRPQHVTCWWDPTGEPLAECEIDLRLGGAFRFVTRNALGGHEFAGVYREIASPTHFIFEAMGAIGRVNLEEKGGKTLLTVRIECESAEQFKQYLKMGIHTGTARTLDNLSRYVGATAPQTARVGSAVSSVRE